jgi:DNA invertase Pin-like site-specific DNA recombinase
VSFGSHALGHRFSAIGFCRLSTEEQAQEGRAGLLRQHQEIRLSVERWNLEIVRTVEIADVSGTQVLESQEFQELLHSLPDVDGVVVAAIDRLMRPPITSRKNRSIASMISLGFIHYQSLRRLLFSTNVGR